MQQYSGIAAVYDIYMDHIPYEEWTEFTVNLLKENGIKEGLVLELGCGTGAMTRRLADQGYDMIGIDISEEMLSLAREQEIEDSKDILYLCQDMRSFELYGTVAAVVCFCDTMNYMLTREELLSVFRLVNNYLDPGGLFVFDLDTLYAYRDVLGDNTTVENRREGTFIWENTYYEEKMMNEVNLTVFVPEYQEKSDDYEDMDVGMEYAETDSEADDIEPEAASNNFMIYLKYQETHYRRGYTMDEIRTLIEEAGMEWVGGYDSLTKQNVREDSERVYIIAREKHQDSKLYV